MVNGWLGTAPARFLGVIRHRPDQMGFPVYDRLGFVTVERWKQWMPSQYVM
jgi:hypothetical protein